MKKLICCLFTVVLAFSMIGKTVVLSENSPKITLSGYEFSTEPITLSVFMNWPQGMGNWGDDVVSQWITETTGVTMDIKWATTGSGEELQLMLAGGEELPDIILTGGGDPVNNMMIQQGFVAPLDELAKEYFPPFLDLLPGGLYEIYQDTDGHLYRTADWYSDPERIQKFLEESGKPLGAGDQSLGLNKVIYEELGSPDVSTLSAFREYLKAAHEAHPEAVPLVLYYLDWNNVKDAVNFFYRLNGGQTWVYDPGDGTLKVCISDPRYKAALKFLNDLSQDGTLTDIAYNMSFDDKNFNLSEMNVIAYVGQLWEWFSKVSGGDQIGGPILPIVPPMADGLSLDDLKLRDGGIAAVGGNTAAFISADAKNPERAIQYFAFAFTDEAQIANRFGLEGITWERNPDDGMIQWTKEYNDYVANNGWLEMSKKYGPNNGTHSWFTSIYATVLESPASDYPIAAYNGTLQGQYLVNERLFEVSRIIDNDDMRMKLDQLMMVVTEHQPLCIFAKDDEAFEVAYTNYVRTAEAMDIASLEEYFTTNYQKWLAQGVK